VDAILVGIVLAAGVVAAAVLAHLAQKDQKRVRVLVGAALIGYVYLAVRLLWEVHRARTFLPPSDFTLTEGQVRNVREFAEWSAVRLTMTTAIVYTLVLALGAWMGLPRLRKGAVTCWRDLKNVQSAIDALAKTAAVVGVIVALDIFALPPRLQTSYVCATLPAPDAFEDPALKNAYGGKAPSEVKAALLEWANEFSGIEDIKTDPSDLNACAFDQGYQDFKAAVIDNPPDPALRPLLRRTFEEHSYQVVSISLFNYGRGSALNVHAAMPVPFELTDGPQGTFDLGESEGVSWRMTTAEGEIGHDPTVEFGFESARNLDLTFYAFVLLLAWGVFVAPALVAEFWRNGYPTEQGDL
jgi:hypothetical protein